MIKLDNVTLICVEGITSPQIVDEVFKVFKYCSRKIEFGETVFVSPALEDPQKKELFKKDIKYHEIKPMTWLEYGAWSITDFYKYVNLDFCLTVTRDGFILNPHLWDDRFLNYDYIGAKWDPNHLATCKWLHPEIKAKGNFKLVGNIGFCLRSQKMLHETANAPFPVDGPDDAYMCNNYKDYFLQRGIKYGTNEIADLFSREMNHSINFADVFGFHGEKAFIKNL
jgi:hypothetical protein